MAAYRQDILDVKTDSEGFASQLLRDDGTTLPVKNRVGDLLKDTSYRVVAVYVEESDGVHLSSVSPIPTSSPRVYEASSVVTDPLDVEAVWQGGGYINMRVSLKTGGGVHSFGFMDDGITTATDGSKRLSVTLLHDQGEDPLYYSRTTYLACSLKSLGDALKSGQDSVSLTVHTFSGLKTWKFPL